MKDVKDITCCVVDFGLFLPMALTLAETYKRTLFYNPGAVKGFPTVNDCAIGDGFERLEKCEDIFAVKKEVDLWVFPDIGLSGLQKELVSQGCAVWGSRDGDALELKRRFFHDTLGKLGLNVPPYEPVQGLTALREHLRDKENKFIKISRFRGSLETTKFRNMDMDEGLLNQWAVKFGPVGEKLTFLVFDELETELEIGGDTFNVRGRWPKRMLQGYEWKDKGYLASVTDFDKMPEPVREVMDAFAPVLQRYEYTNFWSMELRVVKGEAYFIDPCCRGPMPATNSQLKLMGNLPEIILAGAHGELLEPDYKADFVAEAILTMKCPKEAWGKTRVPEALATNMRLSNACEVDGAVCFPPVEQHGEEIGWLVEDGNSPKNVITKLLALEDELPDGVTAHTESMIDLLKEIHKAEDEGMEFTEKDVPDPEMVVAES